VLGNAQCRRSSRDSGIKHSAQQFAMFHGKTQSAKTRDRLQQI